jgi:hypothetical protein
MESDLRVVQSPVLEKKKISELLEIVSAASKEAAELRDEAFVENPELRRSLNVVESFLRKKRRVCYGGMAINAHLPSKLKFYDFSKTLPDYDFFTYEPEKDVELLMDMMHKAGFTDVDARLGIHKGTTKLYVNYVGVADITFMPHWMYTILHKRAIKDDGIYYTDADFLRMNMYLELSRPRGEVERWDKVYKRLLLLNMAKSTHSHSCKRKASDSKIKIGKQLHELLIHYVVQNHLIFAGAELKRVYSNPSTQKAGYILRSQSPILAYATNPEYHIPILRQIIHENEPSARIRVVHWPSTQEGFPEMWGIQRNGDIVFVCIQELYCNSYTTVQLPENQGTLNIVSLDSAITLFYMLTFIRGMEGIVPNSLHCFADSLVDISSETRDKGKKSVYPLFVTQCHGHQESKASLLKAKKKRVESMKRKIKKSSSKTLKQKYYKNITE